MLKMQNKKLKSLHLFTVLSASLIMSLFLPVIAGASGPEGGRRVGLLSTEVACLAVESGTKGRSPASVRLEWEGQIEDAFLVMSVAGSERGHSIYVNGQRVGSAPVQPEDQPCRADLVVEISIPADVLVKGENEIILTNDAQTNDAWTAAGLHLEIHGDLSGPPVSVLEYTSPARVTLKTTAIVTNSTVLTSSYDGIPHVVWYQEASAGYSGPRPLIVGIHGYSAFATKTLNYLSPGAFERGWLVVAPDMHGQYHINDGRRAFAWLGAQHDIIDAIEYMMDNYNVDTSRIYVTGGSMGGETAAVMAAKYPDILAAAAPWKPITHLANWYYELPSSQTGIKTWLRRETGYPGCDTDVDTDNVAGCGTPQSGDPNTLFEYRRRSPIEMPQNSRLLPIKIWHDVQDELVFVAHSLNLKAAIDSWNPPLAVTLSRVDTGDPPNNLCELMGNSVKHCYNPPPLPGSFTNTITLTVDSLPVGNLFDYLENFSLNSQPPLSLTIRTDESKPYYWLNVVQTGGDHWAEIEASYNLSQDTVTATISDTNSSTVGFNLGTTQVTGSAGLLQPGMGLPATTYLVKGGGNNDLSAYNSGYLTVTLASSGQFSLTISPIKVVVTAGPNTVLGGQTVATTITATVKDQLGNPVPDGTAIVITSTKGTFSGGVSTYTGTTTSGQLVLPLTLDPADSAAQIEARVESVVGTTTIEVINPAIAVSVIPDQTTIVSGKMVTYSYRITNTGDVTLTNVTLIDNNGTPGNAGDDILVCPSFELTTVSPTKTCSRSATLTQTITNTATVSGTYLLNAEVMSSDTATVIVQQRVYMAVVFANPTIVLGLAGQPTTSTITAAVEDQLNEPPPDGEIVEFFTTEGTWPNGGITYTTTTTGGQATAILTLAATDDLAQITATVDSAMDTIAVDVIHPAIAVTVTPDETIIPAGGAVTYTYQIENTGDFSLTNVTLTDNTGILVGCNGLSLAIGEVKNCGNRSVILNQTTANIATAVGTALSLNDVSGSNSTTVTVATIDVVADPTGVLANGVETSTITALIKDADVPLPDGTVVQFSTDKGTLSNGGVTTIGGGQGKATIVLTSASTGGLATVKARVGSATGSTFLNMIDPSPIISVSITADKPYVVSGQTVTYTYTVANSGNVTLTNVSVVDDNGTPGDFGDDYTPAACANILELAIGALKDCGSRPVSLIESVTNTVRAIGTNASPGDVTASDSVYVTVQAPVYAVDVLADPTNVSTIGGQSATTTIIVDVEDQFHNPPPNGMAIVFSTTQGVWPNASTIYTTTVTGRQTTAILTLAPTDSLAQIEATVGGVADTTLVNVIHPAIEVSIRSSEMIRFIGQVVTYTYQIRNTGDVALTNITLVDDNGTPEDSGDDITITACQSPPTLGVGQVRDCGVRSVTITSLAKLNTVTVTGKDPLQNDVEGSGSFSPSPILVTIYLPIVIKN